MTKHKWANEIKAWANGAEIESESQYLIGVWQLDTNPEWGSSEFIFRVKQEPVEPQYLYAYKKSDNEVSWDVAFIEPHDLADDYQYVGKTLLIAGE